MEVLEAIRTRHSYRGKYKETPVPRTDLLKIMEAGLAAPSGCNKQTTSLIGIDDPDVLKKVYETVMPEKTAPAPAAVCVLTQRIIAYGDCCFSVQDYAAAIENMLLAAAALGYDSCWYEGRVTGPDRKGNQVAKTLGVPDGYELVCFLPIGVAAEPVKGPEKKAFEERAWLNGFGKNA